MPPFSFVHTADLHLDSPFLGLGRLSETHSRIAEELREATFKAFHSVIDLCIHQVVDFLLVAGDVYDGADRSLRAQLRFRDGLRRLNKAGVRAYVVHGNHDPLDGWANSLKLPEGVHDFGPELESVVFEKEGVPVARVHGISYPTRKIGKRFGNGFKREGSEAFQIGLFHCNAGGDIRYDPYAPRSESELAESELDYWALGHIHESVVMRRADPFIGYPGNTQGRHINEAGRRGCFLVRVSAEGKMEGEPEFVATDTVRWLVSKADITGMDSMDALLSRAEEMMDELVQQAEGRPVVARVEVCGRGPIHRALTRPNAARDLLDELHSLGTARTPFIWVEQLVLRTRLPVDLDVRRGAQDFLGDLLRSIEVLRRSPEKVGELGGVLADLYQHARASKVVASPDEATLRTLLDQAESRCVDLLAEEDD